MDGAQGGTSSEVSSAPAMPNPATKITKRLPLGRNIGGRPVWEPPIFNYAEWIDDHYDKKREAVMKFYGNDRAKTTDFLDIDTESDLFWVYAGWLIENQDDALSEGDGERAGFLDKLRWELATDWVDVDEEFRKLGHMLVFGSDGEWAVRKRYYDTPSTQSAGEESEGGDQVRMEGCDVSDEVEPQSADAGVKAGIKLDLAPSGEEDASSSTPKALETLPAIATDLQWHDITPEESHERSEETDDEMAPNDLLSLWW